MDLSTVEEVLEGAKALIRRAQIPPYDVARRRGEHGAVFLDDDTRVLFATAYDGDWDTYIDDFATKIPELMDLLFANVEGWPGIDSPKVKDFIADHQIDAAAWFVANPQVTVVDVRRYQRMEQALDTFFDAMAANTAMDATTREALSALSDAVATPQGVDY